MASLSAQPTSGSTASRLLAGGLTAGRFVLHFVEMLLAMYAGMLVFMALPGVMALPTVLHQLGMALAMTVPMVAWMRIRGHGWRHGLAMAAGMLVPWAAVLGLLALGAGTSVPWLNGAADPAMLLGMLGSMLVRRDHFAHGGAHQHSATLASRPKRLFPRRLLLPLAYLGAVGLTPLVVGSVNLGSKALLEGHEPVDPSGFSSSLPTPPTPDPNKKIAVVLAGYNGSEIGDTLESYEVLARSGVFNVYSVAPERTVMPLRTGPTPWGNSIDFAPQFSFEEYDSLIGRAPDVIAIPYFQADPTSARDAVVFQWLRDHFGSNTTLLGICSGTLVLADSGLAAGHTATSNTGTFDYVEAHSPTTRWLRNLRYVDDGNIVTSSNLTAGIDATLHVVDRFAGRATALEVARQIGYTQTGALDDPRFEPPADNLGPRVVAVALQGPDPRIGVLVYDGVTELGVSGIVDPFDGSFFRTSFMSAQRGVTRARDGFLFVPRYDVSTAPALDRVVVSAGENPAGKQAVVAAWNANRGRPTVDDIYQSVGSDGSAYDASLRDIAPTRSSLQAHLIDETLFYTAIPRDFSAASWIPTEALLVIALMLFGAVGVFGVTHIRLARRAHPAPAPQPA